MVRDTITLVTDSVRYIACGGRDVDNATLIRNTLALYHPGNTTLVTLVTGGQRMWKPRLGRYIGADYQAERAAEKLGWTVETHPADWKRHGRAAGPIRNRAMAKAGAVRCIAFPGGKGTQNMIEMALSHNIPVARVDDDGHIDVIDPTPSLF